MTRVEEHREYLWRMDSVAPQREAEVPETSGVVDDEWAADVSGADGGSASSADIELRGAHGATRRKHVIGQSQSSAELQINPPGREDTRGRAMKPVLTDEIALDQAALDAKELAASQERMEAVAQQQALEARAAQARGANEERRVMLSQGGGSDPRRTRRKPDSVGASMRSRTQGVPMRTQPQIMDDEDTAPEIEFRRASSGRR